MEKNKIIENIIKKSQMKIAISELVKEENTVKKNHNFSRSVAIVTIALGIGTSLAYATGTGIYEKIWKQPKSYKITNNVTDEEKKECITKEKAEEIGNDYLKKIGFDEETIKNLNLYKDFVEGDNSWLLNSKKVSMGINAKSGKIEYVNIPTWEYKIPYNYGITREEAIKVAKELLKKYKPEDYTGKYELVKLTRNMETDKGSYIWYADFYKKYGELINSSEKISIGWIPTINGLYSLSFENITYENNEQKISKDEAIKIATERDKQIEKNKSIIETKAEIKIRRMNADVYLRENFKDEYEKGTLNMEKTGENTYKLKEDAVIYKTEKRVRKVWCVVIKYSDNMSFSYYIDCTTGEIIGGTCLDDLGLDELLKNDPNNVID